MDAVWEPIGLAELTDRFAAVDVPWWIAGGVAIDCFLGWETRAHDDVDVEMFRSDRAALFEVFDGWDLHAMSEGELTPWTGEPLPPSVFGIWGRRDAGSPWAVEIILADGDTREWRFRRDPTISLPFEQLVRTTPSGLPFCTPEVQLLYKAKRHRPKDDTDLARCLHHLDVSQCRWLADAIARAEPHHPWVAVLANAERRTRMDRVGR